MPARRLIAVLYCMLVDQPVFTEDAESKRQDLIIALEWPDKGAEMEAEREDEQNRLGLAAMGLGLARGIVLPPGVELVPE